jgi:hypothetical protein
MQTSRELVTRAIRFEYPERVPRDLWVLPWAERNLGDAVAALRARFPSDITGPPGVYRPSPRRKGLQHDPGTFTDEWGCVFENIYAGVHGEVRNPMLADIRDWRQVEPPYELLPEDLGKARDEVNRFYAETDKFVCSGCCPRPWERLQFIRGSQNAMLDIMEPDTGARQLIRVMHEFFMKELEFWVTTDVDAINMMDDWGAQDQLLIPPPIWRELFKPLYKEYCDAAHAHGKLTFMHSDGHISEIYEDLVEVGVNAVNSQLFCMDMADLERRVKGKITFWGEIDRQHVLGSPDPEVGRQAVREVVKHLWDPSGGVIAQFEYTVGTNPETAIAVFEEWERVSERS